MGSTRLREPAPRRAGTAAAALEPVLRVSRDPVPLRADASHALHLLPVLTGLGLRRFLNHLVRFAALPAVLLLAGEAILQWTGELWSLDRVLAYQRAHDDALFLRATDQAFYAYKYQGILTRKPSVLVAGSSRTMKFRAEMFGERAKDFYNAGGMLNSLRDVRDFCVTLPSTHTPAILLLGIDLWWLNDSVEPTYRFHDEVARGATVRFDDHVIALRWLVRHPLSTVYSTAAAMRGSGRDAIGIGALAKGGGFRADGSFKSAVPTPQSENEWRYVDRESPPILERVAKAVANFPPASYLSSERLAVLDATLARYAQQGVLVVGYLPPFSSEVLARLRSDARHSRLWADFT